MKALYTLEKQRGDVQQALFEMSVWNTFDPDMIREMFDHPNLKQKHSVGEQVRLKAIMESRRRRRNVSLNGEERSRLDSGQNST